MSQVEQTEDLSSTQDAQALPAGAWAAADHPPLHPTQRRVLEALNEMTAGQGHVTSRALREALGMSPQLLNRHLRALGHQGLAHVENPGAGLPLLAKITSQGQRVLGGHPVAAPPSSGAPAPDEIRPSRPPAAAYYPEPPQSQGMSKLEMLTHALYRSLGPHMKRLDAPTFLRLVRESLSVTLGKPVPPPQAAVPELPSPGHQAPPSLNALEQSLEERLAMTSHGDYRGMAWYERTREFTNIWDQMRRRAWGLLNTYFLAFGPRWNHPEWENFNRARRLADVRGARYEEWIGAQFKRLLARGASEVPPQELIGEEAAKAWERLYRPPEEPPKRKPSAGPPPYTLATFDRANPAHAAYAEELLDEIAYLAGRVYGNDPQGPIRLIAQAVAQGNIPEAAMDLRPEWKAQVLELRRVQASVAVSSQLAYRQGNLPVII